MNKAYIKKIKVQLQNGNNAKCKFLNVKISMGIIPLIFMSSDKNIMENITVNKPEISGVSADKVHVLVDDNKADRYVLLGYSVSVLTAKKVEIWHDTEDKDIFVIPSLDFLGTEDFEDVLDDVSFNIEGYVLLKGVDKREDSYKVILSDTAEILRVDSIAPPATTNNYLVSKPGLEGINSDKTNFGREVADGDYGNFYHETETDTPFTIASIGLFKDIFKTQSLAYVIRPNTFHSFGFTRLYVSDDSNLEAHIIINI